MEREYVEGADRETVTFGGLGCELRVSKIIVSSPSAASQGMVGVGGDGMSDTDTEPLAAPARESKASVAQVGQWEMVVGLKHSLYFLPGRSEEVTNGSS